MVTSCALQEVRNKFWNIIYKNFGSKVNNHIAIMTSRRILKFHILLTVKSLYTTHCTSKLMTLQVMSRRNENYWHFRWCQDGMKITDIAGGVKTEWKLLTLQVMSRRMKIIDIAGDVRTEWKWLTLQVMSKRNENYLTFVKGCHVIYGMYWTMCYVCTTQVISQKFQSFQSWVCISANAVNIN